MIALFQGSRASDPAAALAAWKRATRDAKGLSKPLEAAIATLNPEMVSELRALDEAELGLGFDPEDGHVRWYAIVPHDEGTIAAMATALTLTGGGSDLPWNGLTINRLGPPGSAVVARVPGVLVVTGSRDELPVALKHARAGAGLPAPVNSGWRFRLDPRELALTGPLSRRTGRDVPGKRLPGGRGDRRPGQRHPFDRNHGAIRRGPAGRLGGDRPVLARLGAGLGDRGGWGGRA